MQYLSFTVCMLCVFCVMPIAYVSIPSASATTVRIDSLIDTIGPVVEKQSLRSDNQNNGMLYNSALMSNGGSVQEVKNTRYQGGGFDATTILTYDSQGTGHMMVSERIGYQSQSFASNETDPFCVFGPPYAVSADPNAPLSYIRGIASSSIATGDALSYHSTANVRSDELSYQFAVTPLHGENTTNARVSTDSSFAVDTKTDMTRVHEDLLTVGQLEQLMQSYQMGEGYHSDQQLSSQGAVIEHTTIYDVSEDTASSAINQLTYTAGATVGNGTFDEVHLLSLDDGLDTTRVIRYDQEETSGGIIVTEYARAERDAISGNEAGTGPDCVFSDTTENASETSGSAEAYASSRIIGVDAMSSETTTRIEFGSGESGIDLQYESHVSSPIDLRSEFELYVHDLNGDGLYEDLNNNGRLDFVDLIMLFDNMIWLVEDERGLLFDYNLNGKLDYADIIVLFDLIQQE